MSCVRQWRAATSTAAVPLSVAVSTSVGACDPTCPPFENPCPERLDLIAWCGAANCEVDGKPFNCAGGCRLDVGVTLSIPIDVAMTAGHQDLLVELSGSACSGGTFPRPPQMSVSLGGQVGAPFKYAYPDIPNFVFRWDPLPPLPATLEVRYDDPALLPCITIHLAWVDAACEAANPQPSCPL